MRKSLIMIAAALFIFAGCQKEASVKESTSNNVIHIGVKQLAPPTKVAADDIAASPLTFKWEEGDQVAFIDNDNYERIIIYTCTNPATGEFSGEALNPDATYFVGYPNDNSGTFIYRENQIPKGHSITNEEVSGSATTFTLDTHETIIHFKLKGAAKVGSIALSNGYTDDDYTLSCGDGVQLSDTATDFYMDAMYMDSHKLSSFAYTLRIYDTNNKELKSVSFHLKEENQGTIVDFNDPLTVNASSEPEYVEMNMSTGQKAYKLKWATMNLGATTVAGSYTTCYGDLYQWGSVNTLYDGFPYTSATECSFSWKTGKTGGFITNNSEYTGNDATLPDANDVVKQTIGGGWRMPTSKEFKDLYDACINSAYDTSTNPTGASVSVGKGVYWCTSYDGVTGCLFCDGTNRLFFPAAGGGRDTSILLGGNGLYWSSSLYTKDNVYAYSMLVSSSQVYLEYNSFRQWGISVRPVLDCK